MMPDREYSKTSAGLWFHPHNKRKLSVGIVEIVPRRPDEMRVYIAEKTQDGGVGSTYISLKEAELLALNILAMIQDIKRNGAPKDDRWLPY
jgi:hypothetical protein